MSGPPRRHPGIGSDPRPGYPDAARPGPSTAFDREDLPAWVDRHLADSAALLSPEEDGVVVFVPPGLGASRQAIGSWAERHSMVADFAAPEPDEEGQGELVRLTRVQVEEAP